MTKLRILGLTACDTCRAARKALEGAGYEVTFQDVRKDPLGRDEILKLWQGLGDELLNKSSTTWRGLDEASKASDPIELILANPALMKRPVIQSGVRETLGWGAPVQKIWLSEA